MKQEGEKWLAACGRNRDSAQKLFHCMLRPDPLRTILTPEILVDGALGWWSGLESGPFMVALVPFEEAEESSRYGVAILWVFTWRAAIC